MGYNIYNNYLAFKDFDSMFDLKTELKNLPDNPGVYIMHDKNDKVIYVGKAKILKNRVRQYFRNSASHTPKVLAMVKNVAYFEYIITDSETEALVLECNLIKKYRPHYNILLKDDKTYPYIRISMNEPYPKITAVRRRGNDKAKYFGPYMGMNTINNMLEIIRRIFMPPTCRRRFPEDIGKGRPCLNYHIKKCMGVCTGNITRERYYETYENICKFLSGDHAGLLEELETEMKEASAKLDFERAADARDKIRAINSIDSGQKITDAGNASDKDYIAVCFMDELAFFSVFFVRGGKTVGRECYRVVRGIDTGPEEIMAQFISQFYDDSSVPSEIVVQYMPSEAETIQNWLRELKGRKVSLVNPRKGDKLHFIEMAYKNSENARDRYKVEEQRFGRNRINEELAKALGLSEPPRRIESYDISNISGADSVGAMVVFCDGIPKKRDFRRFKIKYTEGIDDYESTAEVVYRRIARAKEEQKAVDNGELLFSDAKFLPLPDLILADGGMGHVNAIKEILEATETYIPVYGMVKDDKHRTRGIVSENGEIELNPSGTVFKFVTRVQDEVHRYAIEYFRKLHGKNALKSGLDDIPGVGEKRRIKLLTHFKTISNIKNASLEELRAAVDKKTADSVYNYFRQNGDENVQRD